MGGSGGEDGTGRQENDEMKRSTRCDRKEVRSQEEGQNERNIERRKTINSCRNKKWMEKRKGEGGEGGGAVEVRNMSEMGNGKTEWQQGREK